MGSCFSSERLPICNRPIIAKQALDDQRIESTFGAVYYGHNPVPYGNKVVRCGDQGTNFDCYLSATTTAITLRKKGEDLTIAQIGASGAVLGTRDENNALISVRLTVDRIRLRPELHNRKDTQYIIPSPFITQRRITDADEFVVLATAGVWEMLSREDVVAIVGTCRRRSDASQAVVDAVVRAWMHKYPALEVDDCAVACLFLNPQPPRI